MATPRIAAPLANPVLDAHLAYTSGLLERNAGHYDLALGQLRQALELALASGNLLFEGLILFSLGWLAATTDSDDAEPALRDAITRLVAGRNWLGVWLVVEAAALYWARMGRVEPAAVLLGHLEANHIQAATFVDEHAQIITTLVARGDAQEWLTYGATLERDQLVAYALSHLADAQR